jgi:hypothetical protein
MAWTTSSHPSVIADALRVDPAYTGQLRTAQQLRKTLLLTISGEVARRLWQRFASPFLTLCSSRLTICSNYHIGGPGGWGHDVSISAWCLAVLALRIQNLECLEARMAHTPRSPRLIEALPRNWRYSRGVVPVRVCCSRHGRKLSIQLTILSDIERLDSSIRTPLEEVDLTEMGKSYISLRTSLPQAQKLTGEYSEVIRADSATAFIISMLTQFWSSDRAPRLLGQSGASNLQPLKGFVTSPSHQLNKASVCSPPLRCTVGTEDGTTKFSANFSTYWLQWWLVVGWFLGALQ